MSLQTLSPELAVYIKGIVGATATAIMLYCIKLYLDYRQIRELRKIRLLLTNRTIHKREKDDESNRKTIH